MSGACEGLTGDMRGKGVEAGISMIGICGSGVGFTGRAVAGSGVGDAGRNTGAMGGRVRFGAGLAGLKAGGCAVGLAGVGR
jgi:hypothetical protein